MAKAAKKRNISAAGRAAMTRAGNRTAGGNFAAMTAGLEEKKGIRAQVAAFRAALLKKVDTEANPGTIALVDSAAASYALIRQLLLRLSAANLKRAEMVDGTLATAQAEMRRTLRLLGISEPDPEADTGPTLEEYCADLAERKRAEVTAAEPTPNSPEVSTEGDADES